MLSLFATRSLTANRNRGAFFLRLDTWIPEKTVSNQFHMQTCIRFGFTKCLSISPHNRAQYQLKTDTSIHNFQGIQKYCFSFLHWTWPSPREVAWKGRNETLAAPVCISLHQISPLKRIVYWLIHCFISWLTSECLCHFPDMVNASPTGILFLMEHLAGGYYSKVPTERGGFTNSTTMEGIYHQKHCVVLPFSPSRIIAITENNIH